MPQPVFRVRSQRLLADNRALSEKQPGHTRALALVHDLSPDRRIPPRRHPACLYPAPPGTSSRGSTLSTSNQRQKRAAEESTGDGGNFQDGRSKNTACNAAESGQPEDSPCGQPDRGIRIVSEVLANVAKHANAETVMVSVEVGRGVLSLSVRDDRVSGADPAVAPA